MKKYYPSIQVMRAALFLCVLAFHAGIPLAEFGWGGVEAFFVISSFFLVKKHYGKEIEFKTQFLHRIRRLYPPYVAVIIMATIVILLMGRLPIDLPFYLFSMQNFYWIITNYSSPLQPFTAHTWTLVIEVWCGLVMLVLLKLIRDRKIFVRLIYSCIAIGVVYRTFSIMSFDNIWLVSLNPIAHLDAFGVGAIVAVKSEENGSSIKKAVIACIAGVGLICATVFYLAGTNHISVIQGYQLLSSSRNYLTNAFTGNLYLYISILSAGLVAFLYKYESDKVTSFKKSFLVLIGDYSYYLYLFHWPILVVMKRVIKNSFLLFLSVFIVSIVSAILFERIIKWFQFKCRKGKL